MQNFKTYTSDLYSPGLINSPIKVFYKLKYILLNIIIKNIEKY